MDPILSLSPKALLEVFRANGVKTFDRLRESLRDSAITGNGDGHEQIHKVDKLILFVRDMLSKDTIDDMHHEARKIEAEVIRQRTCGISGILAPIIGLSTVLLSTTLTPGFSWKDHALSKITNTDQRPILMYGLGTAGLLTSLFSYGLYAKKNANHQEKMSAIAFGICGILLSAAASTKEKTGLPHYITAIGYFAIGPLALMLLGSDMMKIPSKRAAGIAASAAGSLALLALLSKINPPNAISESLEAAILGAWALGTGVHLAREDITPKHANNEPLPVSALKINNGKVA